MKINLDQLVRDNRLTLPAPHDTWRLVPKTYQCEVNGLPHLNGCVVASNGPRVLIENGVGFHFVHSDNVTRVRAVAAGRSDDRSSKRTAVRTPSGHRSRLRALVASGVTGMALLDIVRNEFPDVQEARLARHARRAERGTL